jgi:hypothetical protein
VRISRLIVALQAVLDEEGDLVCVHYSPEKHWQSFEGLRVHPAGRPHGRRKSVHAEKVLEIGDDD